MSDQPGFSKQRREYFRIRYPAKFAPIVVIWGRNFQVYDISEMGVRIINPHRLPFPEGYVVRGSITFHDQETIQISGSVAWTRGDDVALRLVREFPFTRILAEQAFLRQTNRE
jgi:c-di-GMP-binding flagellar brake protein YcgR